MTMTQNEDDSDQAMKKMTMSQIRRSPEEMTMAQMKKMTMVQMKKRDATALHGLNG
ncbi:hypothetical protein KP509_1Z097500 [Ceratopteris richardii]|nr:hypothetical protein KP509_1Z097500 [Ceratopteris richardii]